MLKASGKGYNASASKGVLNIEACGMNCKSCDQRNGGNSASIGFTVIAICACVLLWCLFFSQGALADEVTAAAHFRERVQPVLETYCYACHGYGEHKGRHAFDEFKSDKALVGDTKLWSAVLKNVRAGVMPPRGEERPTDDERRRLFDWIEFDAFGIDPADPDPGRVTLRRLNRVEYRNTIRDLMGIDFDTSDEFPADDSGYGFDNVGDALSVSPLLMEKYLNAADAIVTRAVPTKPASEYDKAAQASYRRFFPQEAAPKDAAKRDAYGREILAKFGRRAYRRPVDDPTIDRLVALAKMVYTAPGQSFEAGIGRAMVAVLASPRFLFRVEDVAADSAGRRFPMVDEYALASRLSYFLWSTMPDDELIRLADRGQLRTSLPAQVQRMIKDPRSKALSEDFAGQWLRSRDIETMEIEPIGALGLDEELQKLQKQIWEMRNERRRQKGKPLYAPPPGDKRAEGKSKDEADKPGSEPRWQDRERIRAERRRLEGLAGMFNSELRQAMRDETNAYFDYVVHENRSVTELIDSDYAFVNETLAKHYGIEGVEGDKMRRVELPLGSPRGGVLTQGTILAVTSNPNRTSPVKRGLFILENILGSPSPPAPPPNVPILEVARDSITDHRPTVREAQEKHRHEPLCHACHARMDPLGVALENFNAMGMWRETDQGQKVDPSGELMTGEKIDGIRQLKRIILEKHRLEFYRCLTEKLLIYALGRGLEYYDEHTVDQIVARLDGDGGKFSSLLMGIVESAPFQKQRRAKGVQLNK
jgi:cytochrome c5